MSDLQRLSDEATGGAWECEPDTGAGRVWIQRAPRHVGKDCEPLFAVRDLGTKRDEKAVREAYRQREADAAFIVALVNAFRAGHLVEATQ